MKFLMPKDVIAKVKEIRKVAMTTTDFEKAVSLERDLHRDVLAHVSKGAPEAAKLCRLALLSEKIEFARYGA